MKIYNTLSRKKEEFSTGDTVKMYVCGVTTYSECHIGHAMSYIIFDIIRRYLEFRGYRVKHVQNFTDIDDKIIASANRLGITAKQLADSLIENFFTDMNALNIQKAHIYPKVTEEILEIIEVIKGLIARGYAYQAGNDVYFRVNAFPDYGKLSGRKLSEMISDNQGELGENKEYPMDFALWKSAKPGEPEWDSPWGKGRPGWHIECTAMSLKYLGDTLDIHGGGQDLIFPHHENEIAQAEALTGKVPFTRYWLHNGLLQFEQEKMSKSLGNLITIKEALNKFSPDELRLFVLSSHYRSPITYSDEGVAATGKGLDRIINAVSAEDYDNGDQVVDSVPYRQRFIDAMDDDFNTAQAVAVLFDLAREINRGRERGLQVNEAKKVLIELANTLGLTLKKERKLQPDVAPFIELLVDTRNMLREAKQWQLADTIRDGLGKLGITIEDRPHGTVWKQ